MKNSILILLLAAGCIKTNVTPKPPTDNEKFYCEIDGERFRPDNKGDIFDQVLIADWYVSQGTFTVSAYNSRTGKDVIFGIRLFNEKLKVNKHLVNGNIVSGSYSAGYLKEIQKYDDYKSISGFIDITKVDTLTKTVSGKFEFDLKSVLDNTKIAKIRNGQFNNLHY